MAWLFVAAVAGTVNCWSAAAVRYDVPADLLYAMGLVESDHNPLAIAHANNGTRSVGIMQINSSWFPQLETYGITEADLAEPCVNIQVGAWILRQEVDRYGYTWEAIGAYYAGAYDKKSHGWKMRHYKEYASKVLSRWRAVQARRRQESEAEVVMNQAPPP